MVRHIDDLHIEHGRELGHISRSFPKGLDDPNSVGFRDRLEQLCAIINLNFVTHADFNLAEKMKDCLSVIAISVPNRTQQSDACTTLLIKHQSKAVL